MGTSLEESTLATSVIVQNPRGLELSVEITGSTCHLTEADARAVANTVTISAEEEFFLPDGARLTVSILHNGAEISGNPDGLPITLILDTGMTHYLNPVYDDATSGAASQTSSRLRDNGARVNVYRLAGTTTPASGDLKTNTVAPSDYAATWGFGGGLEAESFGSWVNNFGEYQWVPNEPGEYEIQTEIYLTLSTATPNVATHVCLQPYTFPKYAFTNNRTVLGGAQGGSAIIFASGLDELVAPQNAIDEAKAQYGFWWYWRAGAAETLVTWQAFIWIFQNSPGSPTNIYGEL